MHELLKVSDSNLLSELELIATERHHQMELIQHMANSENNSFLNQFTTAINDCFFTAGRTNFMPMHRGLALISVISLCHFSDNAMQDAVIDGLLRFLICKSVSPPDKFYRNLEAQMLQSHSAFPEINIVNGLVKSCNNIILTKQSNDKFDSVQYRYVYI